MIESNNKRVIYYGFNFLFFCFSIVISIMGFQIREKLSIINDNPHFTTATISEEFIENLGKKQTVGYKLTYNIDDKIYVNSINTSGDYRNGQKIEIIIEKDNPENYLIISKIDYMEKWIYASLFFVVSVLMFIFRNKAITFWRKIAPEY